MKVKINKIAYNFYQAKYTTENNQFKFWFLNLVEIFPIINEFGFVSISSTYMKSRNRNYSIEIKEMIDDKIIITNGSYVVDKCAKGYRINTFNINNMELIEVEVDDKYFNILNDEISNTVKNTLDELELDNDIYNLLNSAKLEKTFGKEYISKISEPVNKIIKKMNYNITRTKTNRLVNNFARMKSELRYYFTLDNERLAEIDASNSQLFFLNILILRDNPFLFSSPDAELFKQLCVNGNIYEYIEQAYKIKYKGTDANRTIIKLSILQAFFSSEVDKNGKKSNYRRNTRSIFEQEFPSIYKFMVEYKEGDSSLLANTLQEIESEFIDEMNKYIEKYISVYDCLYVRESDVEKTKYLLNKIFFSKYGIIPMFKYKILQPISVNNFIKVKKSKDEIKLKLNNIWY